MMDLQAAIGIHQLRRVEKNWLRRRAIWERYREALASLPVILPEAQVRQIIDRAQTYSGLRLHVDLEAQRIWDEDEEISFTFELDQFRRRCLLNGLDDIGLTMQHEAEISAYEARRGL